jgi:hypothetical protein
VASSQLTVFFGAFFELRRDLTSVFSGIYLEKIQNLRSKKELLLSKRQINVSLTAELEEFLASISLTFVCVSLIFT